MKNEIPRRNRLDLNCSAEIAIYNAMQEIEKMAADERLTKAQILLTEASGLIADYIDEVGLDAVDLIANSLNNELKKLNEI